MEISNLKHSIWNLYCTRSTGTFPNPYSNHESNCVAVDDRVEGANEGYDPTRFCWCTKVKVFCIHIIFPSYFINNITMMVLDVPNI